MLQTHAGWLCSTGIRRVGSGKCQIRRSLRALLVAGQTPIGFLDHAIQHAKDCEGDARRESSTTSVLRGEV
jgi:hypothetical protein